jgi:hypothetical protein
MWTAKRDFHQKMLRWKSGASKQTTRAFSLFSENLIAQRFGVHVQMGFKCLFRKHKGLLSLSLSLSLSISISLYLSLSLSLYLSLVDPSNRCIYGQDTPFTVDMRIVWLMHVAVDAFICF